LGFWLFFSTGRSGSLEDVLLLAESSVVFLCSTGPFELVDELAPLGELAPLSDAVVALSSFLCSTGRSGSEDVLELEADELESLELSLESFLCSTGRSESGAGAERDDPELDGSELVLPAPFAFAGGSSA
jgi:hypothetical protein